jgi:hypothetical protein
VVKELEEREAFLAKMIVDTKVLGLLPPQKRARV